MKSVYKLMMQGTNGTSVPIPCISNWVWLFRSNLKLRTLGAILIYSLRSLVLESDDHISILAIVPMFNAADIEGRESLRATHSVHVWN